MRYFVHKTLDAPIPGVEWTGDNIASIEEFCGDDFLGWVPENDNPRIRTLTQTPEVQRGWIIYRYPQGLLVSSATGADSVTHEEVV